jgi:protoheme IX farnesyltransferase
LFLVVFCWTPAHFWALALKYRDDYAAAGIPMLPVVRGVHATTRAIARYAVLTVAVTLCLGLTTTVGPIYVGVAVVAGALFIGAALQLVRDGGDAKRAIRFFGWSNVYLMLIFVAVAVDTLVFR